MNWSNDNSQTCFCLGVAVDVSQPTCMLRGANDLKFSRDEHLFCSFHEFHMILVLRIFELFHQWFHLQNIQTNIHYKLISKHQNQRLKNFGHNQEPSWNTIFEKFCWHYFFKFIWILHVIPTLIKLWNVNSEDIY